MNNPNVNICCQDDDNLLEIERKSLIEIVDGQKVTTTRIVLRCTICGRKHYTLEVPPLDLGIITK